MSKYAKTHFGTKFVSNTNNFINMESSSSHQIEGVQPEAHYNPSSRQGNISIARKSAAEKRDKMQRNARTGYKNRTRQQDCKMSNAFDRKAQKIDIDPTLLFANKQSRCSNYERGFIKNPVFDNGIGKQRKAVSRDGAYRAVQTEDNFYALQERPQSKQSSRIKVKNEMNANNISNEDQFLEFKKQKATRPETSKCNRRKHFEQDPSKAKYQNMADSIRNNDIQMKINFKSDKKITKHPMSAMQRQKEAVQSQRRNFNSSLDPQFLSLFAN